MYLLYILKNGKNKFVCLFVPVLWDKHEIEILTRLKLFWAIHKTIRY